jgi:hypothetical protein
MTRDNPIIIRPHASHYVKECTATDPRRWWMTRFDHRAAAHAPLEWCRCRPLTRTCGTYTNGFLIKKIKHEKYQNIPHCPLNYTKYLQKWSFFLLSFLRLKVLFYSTWKLKKNLKYPCPRAHVFFLF